MLEFTSYNKLIYKLLRSLTEFYELVTAIWFVETPGCHLTHLTSTSDAENMKLPKQEYAAGKPSPWHHSNNSQRGLCCENMRITRTAAVGRSWHFVIFITLLEVRRAGWLRLAKQTVSWGSNTDRAGINILKLWVMTLMNLPDIQDRRRRRRGLDVVVFMLLPNFLLIPAAAQPYLFVPRSKDWSLSRHWVFSYCSPLTLSLHFWPIVVSQCQNVTKFQDKISQLPRFFWSDFPL